MVFPDRLNYPGKKAKYKPKDFRLLSSDLEYEVKLYNKPYDLYLYRDDEYGQVSEDEFNEWQYHYFDFYRYFNADYFLEKIISSVINGKLRAFSPGQSEIPLNRDEFIKMLQNYPGEAEILEQENTELSAEHYSLSDLNAVLFHEDWYINPRNLQIYKDVKGITVLRSETIIDQYTGDFMQETKEPLFSVWF